MNLIQKLIDCIKMLIVVLVAYSSIAVASGTPTEIRISLMPDRLTRDCLHIPHGWSVEFFKKQIQYINKQGEPYVYVNYHASKEDNPDINKDIIQHLNDSLSNMVQDVPFSFIVEGNAFKKKNEEIFCMNADYSNKQLLFKFYLGLDLSQRNKEIPLLLENFHKSQQPDNLSTNTYTKTIFGIGFFVMIAYMIYRNYR